MLKTLHRSDRPPSREASLEHLKVARCGVATYAQELFSAVDDLDTLYVPIGMGPGICAVIRTRDLLGLKTDIVGVVAARAPASKRRSRSRYDVQRTTADERTRPNPGPKGWVQ